MSSLLSNPAVNSDSSPSRRKRKKKKIRNQAENLESNSSSIQWKSEAQQQIYASRLFNALRQVRLSSSSSGAQTSCPKRVHEAANRILAAAAKGRSRWSRAILTNRLKLKFMKKNNIAKRQRQVMTAVTTGNSRVRKKSKVTLLRLKSKCLPSVQRKERLLGKLVPGCRKQPLQVVLEEAIDYIPALEMQVRAMSALAELLSVSGSSSSAPAMSATGGVNQLGSSGAPPS